MQIYATIHIKDGKCFDPSGERGSRNIFTSSPVKLAQIWEEAGASCLHVVDVDGAQMGFPIHKDLIAQIVQAVQIPVQAGGGIRSIKDADSMMHLGLEKIVCGTEAVRNQRFVQEVIANFGSEHFVTGIDAVNGMVAVEGREVLSKYNPISLINSLAEQGVQTVIYTDIDGSHIRRGPSIDNTREILSRTNIDLIYSGGIDTMADLEALAELKVVGVLFSHALYTGEIDLREAIEKFEK